MILALQDSLTFLFFYFLFWNNFKSWKSNMKPDTFIVKILFLSNLFTEGGARTYSPKIKTHELHRLSHPGAPKPFPFHPGFQVANILPLLLYYHLWIYRSFSIYHLSTHLLSVSPLSSVLPTSIFRKQLKSCRQDAQSHWKCQCVFTRRQGRFPRNHSLAIRRRTLTHRTTTWSTYLDFTCCSGTYRKTLF